MAQLFAAGPLLLSLFAYRQRHLQHHRAPMVADDPVAIVFGIADYPVTRRRLLGRLLRDVTGIGYVLAVRNALRRRRPRGAGPAAPAPAGHLPRVLGSILVSNGALLGTLAALGHAWLYVGLWLLPALTFLQLFAHPRHHRGCRPSRLRRPAPQCAHPSSRATGRPSSAGRAPSTTTLSATSTCGCRSTGCRRCTADACARPTAGGESVPGLLRGVEGSQSSPMSEAKVRTSPVAARSR
nr:fatty acid desaturase [Xanthomonas sp.]